MDCLGDIKAELEVLNQRIHAYRSFDATPEDLLDEYHDLLDRWTRAKARLGNDDDG